MFHLQFVSDGRLNAEFVYTAEFTHSNGLPVVNAGLALPSVQSA